MRRALFVRNNKDRWKEFEDLLNSPGKKDPDKLSDLFIRVTDDLSYVNTQYPGSDTANYLNGLASKVHLEIYRNKKESRKRMITFWTREVPLIFFKHRMPLLYSFVIFTVAILIGVVSAQNDDGFVRLILGNEYVDMTLRNIENGEPMGVYGQIQQFDMFFMITLNNIMVSFRTFIWGSILGGIPLFILLSFGTGFFLFYNGVMLGAFQYMFYDKGLLMESFLTIWIHGTIEISAIIMAGAAGIAAGNSFFFPGSYGRIDSLIRGFKDGIKMVLGLIPLFIIAGFLESFITRLFDLSSILKALIILASLTFIIFYFIVYPRKVARKHGN